MNKLFKSKVISNEALTEEIYLISLEIPDDVETKPGQFCILRVNQRLDPLLGRPFSIFEHEKGEIKFLYRLKGKGTNILTKLKKGDSITLTGPFGRWYPLPQGDFIVIAGGIGLASVYYLIKKFPQRAYLFYGVRNEKEILFYEELKRLSKQLYISTENETSYAYKGVITELFREKSIQLPFPIYACGPMMMLKELKKIVNENRLCYVATEERMACGVGACLGCVIKTREGFKRVCTDGPVFELKELVL
ncbi:dihydroorotate dehydrogenase electron transfer subunit [Thermodesulfovibrio yellowstonii]|uniref:Dihydroorotate dehydrogenase B (NAD(+)), electron transfer subunit n=1 Tax=Thermodesulfovibrio yellowstonii TaxID=28262 RepID=A0A9W6LL95_9BACT|nr:MULTISPECIES: dihydroorotate dehydrogenase electron transfer subunit [Thermodesulfovibrio]MDI6864362.1 dihydroorotate dehydrogenase electron transfer subunit [Thermodesulfovibrio yellowstonii]GLI54093.1 dihydroorotate dehydrogenase B (NAD(+)), electron transfer subunit [Thermodesulfovibrio islandicus]